jgi:hypothetical protein
MGAEGSPVGRTSLRRPKDKYYIAIFVQKIITEVIPGQQILDQGEFQSLRQLFLGMTYPKG